MVAGDIARILAHAAMVAAQLIVIGHLVDTCEGRDRRDREEAERARQMATEWSVAHGIQARHVGCSVFSREFTRCDLSTESPAGVRIYAVRCGYRSCWSVAPEERP